MELLPLIAYNLIGERHVDYIVKTDVIINWDKCMKEKYKVLWERITGYLI